MNGRSILVTGATGFLGREVVRQAISRHDGVIVFVRRSSNLAELPSAGISVRYGDLNDRESLAQALRGVDVLLNLASLGKGHAPNIVGAAQDAGVPRAVFISTTAIFTTLDPSSKAERIRAEDLIRASGLDYTILRPTMIYGTGRDRNMARLVRFVQRSPVIPIVGHGQCLQQPVHVTDVARASLDVLDSPSTSRKEYNIPGARPVTYEEVIRTVAFYMGKRPLILRLPITPAIKLLEWATAAGLRFPVSAEQVRRLNEDKAFDYSDARRDFGYRPLDFAEGVKLELRDMGFA